MKNLKYLPKVFTAVSFLILLVLFMLLLLGRKSEALRPESLLHYLPDFYLHVSNLAISFLILMIGGYFGLMAGINVKGLSILAIIIILANFIYEMFIPVINECDIVDAYYGTVGTMIGLLWLLLMKKIGMKTNPLFENKQQ